MSLSDYYHGYEKTMFVLIKPSAVQGFSKLWINTTVLTLECIFIIQVSRERVHEFTF